MPVNKKPTIEVFRSVANACGGILSDIAANLEVERNTIYTWCKNDSDFAQALEDSRERFVDLGLPVRDDFRVLSCLLEVDLLSGLPTAPEFPKPAFFRRVL